MATRRVKLTGIAEWSKVFAQNRDTKGYEGAYEDCDGACTIDLIMDDSNLSLLQASRSMKKGSPDKEGRGTKVKFVRKYNTGIDWNSGAPIVLKSDDTKWDLEVDGVIGNGSKVEVYLSVYDTKYKDKCGTRLDRVKVLEAVEVEESFYAEPDILPSKGEVIKEAPQPVVADDAVLF
tara:strand:- start:253 stop:783 length:531 start_codon:yes stop_codon:yes gene_type:complete